MELKINDRVILPFDDKEVSMIIKEFNQFERVDKNKSADTVLLVSEYLYPELCYINKEGTNIGGWKYSDLRLQTMREIYHKFPHNIRDMVVPVLLETDDGYPKFDIEYTVDRIFIPSKDEVSLYNISDKKMYNGNEQYWYWTRSSSANDSSYFWGVNSGGNVYYSNASNNFGVCFCFCVDRKKLEEYLNKREDKIMNNNIEIKVNDIIKLPFNHKDMKSVEMIVKGFDTHNAVDNYNKNRSINNTVLLVSKYLYPKLFYMNARATTKDGWNYSKLRLETMREIYDYFPKEVQDMIVPVLLESDTGYPNFESEYTVDKIFIPSKDEILLYNISSKKMYNADKDNWYWTRSSNTNGSSYFWGVNSDGAVDYDNAYNHFGVCFCFCVDKEKLEKYLEDNTKDINNADISLHFTQLLVKASLSGKITKNEYRNIYKNMSQLYYNNDILELTHPDNKTFKEHVLLSGTINDLCDNNENEIYLDVNSIINLIVKYFLKEEQP